jgi:hypothetical protein
MRLPMNCCSKTVIVCSVGRRPIMLKPAITLISFQKINELGQKILIPSRLNYLRKTVVPQFSLETLRTTRQCFVNAKEMLHERQEMILMPSNARE